MLVKVILAGVAFGLAGYLFAEVSHTIKNYSNRWIKIKWLIQEARKDGILNAAAHSTHTSFTTDGKVISSKIANLLLRGDSKFNTKFPFSVHSGDIAPSFGKPCMRDADNTGSCLHP